ncbi:MAG: transposase [Bacilli bacterium]|nr:transposase [Bacilli bacterium]
MTKISYEDKVNIYTRIKNGESPQRISKEYSMRYDKIRYLIRLIDIHGFEILRTTKNKNYKIYEKEEMINRVLLGGESILSVSADEGLLSTGTLNDWIKKYKEMGYNIVERKRGRPTMPKVTKKNKNETDKEKIKRLEEENLYLKAELEYSKKLRAVVQARKNQQQKKK